MKTLALSACAAFSLLAAPALAQDAPGPAGEAPSAAAEQPSGSELAPPEVAPAPTPAAVEPAPAAPTAAPAPAETGKIIFFRPSRLSGAIYTYHVVEVGEDGKATKDAPRLGSLPNGGAFSAEVEPGLHIFNIAGPMAVNKAEDRLRMEVETGETYYFEQQVRMGLMTGGFRLVPADEARFVESNTKLATPAD